jgi:hypothetical protein
MRNTATLFQADFQVETPTKTPQVMENLQKLLTNNEHLKIWLNHAPNTVNSS